MKILLLNILTTLYILGLWGKAKQNKTKQDRFITHLADLNNLLLLLVKQWYFKNKYKFRGS